MIGKKVPKFRCCTNISTIALCFLCYGIWCLQRPLLLDLKLYAPFCCNWSYGRSETRGFSLKGLYIPPEEIIADGDRKRSPFLILGLSLWYGNTFLFLQQIAPSCAVHARTCCEDFADVPRGNDTQIPKMFHPLAHNSNIFMSVAILLQYLRRKLLQSE